MKIVDYRPVVPGNEHIRYYQLDEMVVDGFNPYGNNSDMRATALCRPEDTARLEQVLAVPGVYYAKVGDLWNDKVVEIGVNEPADWDTVHPLLETLFATMTPATPAPRDWR
jgi:hypothetical protein